MAIFRFPGSKQKLLPAIMPELDKYLKSANSFHDVFVGGGSVLIEVAKKYPNMKLFCNDADRDIYCFWSLVSDPKKEDVILYQMLKSKPTVTSFLGLKASSSGNRVFSAYRGLFLNRTAFSGIASSGPIGGYEQNSKYKIDCRYNSPRLIKEIKELIELMSGRLTVKCQDVQDYLWNIMPGDAVYLDPPYYVKGKELYNYHMTPGEHELLAQKLKQHRNWVLSYDKCPEIDKLYDWARKIDVYAKYSISGKKTSWKKKSEYLITK